MKFEKRDIEDLVRFWMIENGKLDKKYEFMTMTEIDETLNFNWNRNGVFLQVGEK